MFSKIAASIIATSLLMAGTSVCFAADNTAPTQEGALAPGVASGVNPAEADNTNTALEVGTGVGVVAATIFILSDHSKGHTSTRTTHSPS